MVQRLSSCILEWTFGFNILGYSMVARLCKWTVSDTNNNDAKRTLEYCIQYVVHNIVFLKFQYRIKKKLFRMSLKKYSVLCLLLKGFYCEKDD